MSSEARVIIDGGQYFYAVESVDGTDLFFEIPLPTEEQKARAVTITLY